jgi:phage terminase large subunit-like protein
MTRPRELLYGRPLLQLFEKYIAAVLSGDILRSKFVRLTIERHARDLEPAHKRGYKFDPSRAQRVISFIERFTCHSKGEHAGKPFLLDAWQQALIWILFGWVHADTGYRRFHFAYSEIARGNGKSTLAAAIALYMLIPDGEGGAECFSAATKKEQARLVHSEAMRMVRAFAIAPQSHHQLQRFTLDRSYSLSLHPPGL